MLAVNCTGPRSSTNRARTAEVAGNRGDSSTVAHFRRDDNGTSAEADAAAAAAVADPAPVPQQEGTFYDWRQQWYPVHYAADLGEGEPQRVWLFDEAIVVARRPGSASRSHSNMHSC